MNLANRLEAMAAPGSIVISESAYWRLRPMFEIEALDEAELKGIGRTKVFMLQKPREIAALAS